MATPKKPASTRKPAAKRGPTKAAALKALGLTQDDLDVMANLRELREAHQRGEANEKAKELAAKAGAPPEAVEEAVDAPRALEEPVVYKKETPGPPTYFARNKTGIEFRMRLNRHKDARGPRALNPRGQRNDMMKLDPEDLEDEHLIANVELGCIEIITAAEAAEVSKKQAKNQTQAVHPAKALLRDEYGNEVTFHGAEEYVDQSVTVAYTTPVGGEYGEVVVDRSGINRAGGQAAEVGRTLGGNPHLLSDGFAAERARDEVARQKNIEGPAAGGVTSVAITPPMKVVPPKPKGA